MPIPENPSKLEESRYVLAGYNGLRSYWQDARRTAGK